MKYSKSPYSLKELERLRDDEGFIDLDKAHIKMDKASTEPVGTTDRLKFWADFNGRSALIKTDLKSLSGEDNYGIYGELITEEVCKAAGIPSAHYDLIKITGEDGEKHQGVLSENIVTGKKKGTMQEGLVTLYALVGDDKSDDKMTDTSGYSFTIEKLKERLEELENVPKKRAETIMTDLKKRLLFDECILATDNHLENYSFLMYKTPPPEENITKDDVIISLAPSYDRESSFMLDMDQTTTADLLDSPDALFDIIQSNSPRIVSYEENKNYPENEPWKGLFKELIKDPEVAAFYDKIKKIDIEACLDKVEDRIGTLLPDDVRDMATYSFLYRRKAIDLEFSKDIERSKGMGLSRGKGKAKAVIEDIS